jgi:hypothetical protein
MAIVHFGTMRILRINALGNCEKFIDINVNNYLTNVLARRWG